LAAIESAYAIFYWSSIVTLVIADVVAPRSDDPKLIIREINFELVPLICPR